MKLIIQARSADELRTRSDELRRLVDALVDRLQKGKPSDVDPRKLDHAVLQGSVERAQRNVERARRAMLRKFSEVLKEASDG